MDEKIELLFDKLLWQKAIQHCIDKGVNPMKMIRFTEPEFRGQLFDIIMSGNYKVAPPRIALIPKEKGEFRKVYVNTIQDRLVLTMINDIYCRLYGDMIHPKCVSYQKGIGVRSIVQQISRELVRGIKGYKIDISKYFDSVSREAMNEALQSVSTGSPIDKILWDYYNDDIVIDENWQKVEKYKSLCQGCAPSAFFANIMLRDIDAALSDMCSVYYRYSDDILILGDRADEALNMLTEMLSQKGLKVNPKKVQPVSSDNGFMFLGCRIKGKDISIGEKSVKEFTKKMKELCVTKATGEAALRKRIRKINRYLYLDYMNNPTVFGWAEYFFSIINKEEDIVELDTWVKDLLRSSVTGKDKIGGLGVDLNRGVLRGRGQNVNANKGKTKGILEQYGYVSMHHLYKVYRTDRDAYRMEVNRLMSA